MPAGIRALQGSQRIVAYQSSSPFKTDRATARHSTPRQVFRNLTSLLAHHQKHHPIENTLECTWKIIPGTPLRGPREAQLVTNFYGREVVVRRIKNYVPEFAARCHSFPEVRKTSEVAQLYLEQVFGTTETTHRARSGNLRPAVAWDSINDCIVATSQDGYVVSIEGSNLVEAAVYLPRQLEALKRHRPKEGIQAVELAVCGSQSWSRAASPLVIKSNAPNIEGADPATIDSWVNQSVANALANRQ